MKAKEYFSKIKDKVSEIPTIVSDFIFYNLRLGDLIEWWQEAVYEDRKESLKKYFRKNKDKIRMGFV